ncbi:hypothetical protein AB3S75_016411 [Citrus x aurantiifolia]
MIAGLYFFNQCTSLMAQQKEFNLRNPSTYHYDILLLGIKQTWKKMVKSAKECIKQHESNSEIYRRMQAVFTKIDTSPTRSDLIQPSSVPKEMEDLKEFVMKADDGGDVIEKFDLKKHIDACLQGISSGKDCCCSSSPRGEVTKSLEGSSRLICGVGTLHYYWFIHSLPARVFSVLFWDIMDSYRWSIIPSSILLSHQHKTVHSPQDLPSGSSSGTRCF